MASEDIGPAKYLTLGFEGYFHCRIATDPDPTNEQRGMSGYTMALATERALDQAARLQVSKKFWKRHARPPARQMGLKIGVAVNSVSFDGDPQPDHPLLGARVRLAGADDEKAGPLPGPTFESRNNITGSDDNFAFVITPFDLRIAKNVGEGDDAEKLRIRAVDYIDPSRPKVRPWQISDPAIYGRRLPTGYETNSQEVAEAINVFDLYGYFRDRVRFLEREIGRCKVRQRWSKSDEHRARLETKIQEYRSRIYQIEFWGDRVISKMGTRVNWAFEINGPKRVKGNLGGKVDTRQPWPIRIWFGGWDGDLLTGYTRGSLDLPFHPNA